MAHANISGSSGASPEPHRASGVPPTRTGLLVVAGICLLIPVVALCWVSTYARETPRLGGVPFFFWYQFLWVFITAALTYTAHRLVLAARKPGPGTTGTPGRIGRGGIGVEGGSGATDEGEGTGGRHAAPRGEDQ